MSLFEILFLYLLFVIAGSLDSISTVGLLSLSNIDNLKEGGLIASRIHPRLGLRNGEIFMWIFSVFVIYPILIFTLLRYADFKWGLLLGGIYFGFGTKQFQQYWDSR